MRFLFCVFLLIITANTAFAQEQEDLGKKEADSTAGRMLSESAHALEMLKKQQLDDSILRAFLEDQLLSSKQTSNDEKRKLLLEIEVLKGRDSLLAAKRKQKADSMRQSTGGLP